MPKKKNMIGAVSRPNVTPGGFTSTKRGSWKSAYKAEDIKRAANAFLEKRSIVPAGFEHDFGRGFKTR